MSAAHHHIHNMDPTYAPPVIRAPSPSTSLTTEYAPDPTSLSDQELTDEEFARKCEAMIGLEQRSIEPPMILLPKPQTAAEERMMFERVMANLRKEVAALEQEEFFESAIQQRLAESRDTDPSLGELDEILSGMLKPLSPADNTRTGSRVPGIDAGRPSGLHLPPRTGRKGQGSTANWFGYDGPAGSLR